MQRRCIIGSNKMENRIIDLHITKVAIRKIPGGIWVDQFKDVNDVVRGETILSMLTALQGRLPLYISGTKYATLRDPNEYVECKDIVNNISRNIRMILEDETLDVNVESNKTALMNIILKYHAGLSKTLDKLFTRCSINPDTLISLCFLNPIKPVKCNVIDIVGRNNSALSEEVLEVYIKHGAQVYSSPSEWKSNTYVIYSPDYQIGYDIILQHTPIFYGLMNLFDTEPSTGHINSRTIPVLNHIFMYGKYSSFLSCTVLNEFENWIKNLKYMEHTAFTTKNIIYPAMEQFRITNHSCISELMKRTVIYKYNLEALAKNEITVPAYRFHHIAVIFTYLIRNTTILTPDVLRKILTFVFG